MLRRRHLAVGAALAAAAAGSLADRATAQRPGDQPARRVASVDVGAVAGSLAGTASAGLLVAPRASLAGARSELLAGASIATLGGSRPVLQGYLEASAFTAATSSRGPELLGELALGGEALTGPGGSTVQSTASAALHLASTTAGIWAAAGGGYTRSSFGSGPVAVARIGAWRRTASATARIVRIVALTTSVISFDLSQPLPSNAAIIIPGGPAWSGAPPRYDTIAAPVRGTLAAADALFRLSAGRLDADGAAGVQLGAGADGARLALATALWIRSGLAITAALASAPADPSRQLLPRRYISLGFRLGARASAPAPRAATSGAPAVPALPGRERAADGAFILDPAPGGRYTLELDAPGARSVEISGDFTDWRPMPMEPAPGAPGRWRVRLPLRPGTYHVRSRVDGGSWAAPSGLPSARDEFGGRTGLLVVR